MREQRRSFGPTILPSEGLNERRATLHVFDHSKVITLPGAKKGETTTGLAHFYRCTETDTLKRWGFDATFAKDNGGN
jgi:hypothetical protein